MLQDKRYLFWTLQFVGWSGWATSHFLGVVFWDKAPSQYALYLLVVASIGMVISLGLRSVYHYMWESSGVRRIIAVLVASYVAALAWFACRHSIFQSIYEGEAKEYASEGMAIFSYFVQAGSAFWVMLVWSGLYFGIKYYMLLQEEKQRGLKIKAMAHVPAKNAALPAEPPLSVQHPECDFNADPGQGHKARKRNGDAAEPVSALLAGQRPDAKGHRSGGN